MQNSKRVRGLALLTGSVLVASTFVAPAPARADKSDTLKAGAAVLAGAAAVLGAKGKTVPAIIAGAAGYYAYKKGRDEDRKKNDYPYYGQSGQYPQYPGTSYPTNSYPTNNYPTYGNYPTSSYPTNNYPTYDYPSNSYPSYNQPTNYPSGSYGGNNTCHDGSRNTGYNGTYNGGYNGGYNNGSDRYPSSYRAVAPQSAAPAPRLHSNGVNQKVVLR